MAKRSIKDLTFAPRRMNEPQNFRYDYLDVLIRRWRILIAMPILAMLAAAVVSFLSPTVYEATAIIALNPSTLSVPSLNQSPPYYLMVDSPNHLPVAYSPAFYVEMLKSNDIVNAAKPTLPVSIASNSSDRSLIEISARGGSPELAAQTANNYAQVGAQFITQAFVPSSQIAATAEANLKAADDGLAQFSKDNGLGDYDLGKLKAAALPTYEKKIELARLLRARDAAESVSLELARDQARGTILSATANKPIAIAKPAPTVPIAPKTAQNILLGAGLGLLLGILAAFTIEFLGKSKQ